MGWLSESITKNVTPRLCSSLAWGLRIEDRLVICIRRHPFGALPRVRMAASAGDDLGGTLRDMQGPLLVLRH
jgi:hypothetical protein